MDFVIQMIGLFEIIFMNFYIFSKGATKNYSYKIIIPVIIAYTIGLIIIGITLLNALGIYGNGNGFFTLLGFLYLPVLHYLFKETYIEQIFLICFCWIYTLVVYSISMQFGYLFEVYGMYRVVVTIETLLFLLSFTYMRSFMSNTFMHLLQCKDEVIQNCLNKTSLIWLLSIFFVNLLYIFESNTILKILTMGIIVYNVVTSYQLLYEILKRDNRIGSLQYQVSIDGLTGLGSRLRLHNDLNKLIQENKEFYLIYLDLDNFKSINDLYGHVQGDNYLKIFSKEIIKIFNHDQTYRISGDEFIVLETHQTIEECFSQIQKINFYLKDSNIKFLGVSYGYAQYPFEAEEMDKLIYIADKRMYEQKNKKIHKR